jgi:hypothetical protein
VENHENLKAGVLAEIQIGNMPNTNRKRYCYTEVAWFWLEGDDDDECYLDHMKGRGRDLS